MAPSLGADDDGDDDDDDDDARTYVENATTKIGTERAGTALHLLNK